MAFTHYKGIFIKGIVNIIPSIIEDNLDLNLINEEDRIKMVEHTGIRYRRVVDKLSNSVKSFFKKGCLELLDKQGWKGEAIDVLICVTQTSNLNIPAISCQLHDELNLLPDTICLDINLGCSGYVYGLNTIYSLLQSIGKPNAKAILCCGDLSTSIIDSDDKSTKPIFSDAISVTGIECSIERNEKTAFFNLQTVGSGQHAIYAELNERQQLVMRMNGIDVFNYSLRYVPENINGLLEFTKKDCIVPAAFVFHQANQIINSAIASKLKLNPENIPSTLFEYGNTASASIPITLSKFVNSHYEQNYWVLISGFGVGFSIASALVFISKDIYCNTLEI